MFVRNKYTRKQNVMVGWKMDGPARDRVLKLMEEKDRLESEIRDHSAILETNHVGLHESLVDSQGYPRNDIDVYKVRHARHQIICLQNDHKNIMKMIEKGLAEIHADLIGSHGETAGSASTSTTGHLTNGHVANGHISNGHVMNGSVENDIRRNVADLVVREPFAVVTMVTNGSPAELAGLCSDDKILQFGSISHSNFDDMSQIYNIVTHSVGQPINVQVKRETCVVCVNLVPRPWEQPGLLGCHIQRLS